MVLAAPWHAAALVGESQPAPELAGRLVMVLKRSGGAAGFCSASVLAQDVVLTAAHCVGSPADTRVHYRGPNGEPVLAEVAAVQIHPGFRPDAAATRRPSIDLALIRLAQPLPARFTPLALSPDGIRIGDEFRIAGYGVAREGQAATSGVLRAGRISARAPLSSILLWAEDPKHAGTGACTGDSGGAILTLGPPRLVAVIDWAEGASGRRCGSLTQAALVGPQRSWIERFLNP